MKNIVKKLYVMFC